jgi:hypothetical protein
MKQTLNPNLVNFSEPRDPTFVYGVEEELLVFLRDPIDITPHKEVGIGFIEIEVIAESEDIISGIKKQFTEPEAALSTHAGREPRREPHVFLTKDCFGVSGPVRLVIYSDSPFQ